MGDCCSILVSQEAHRVVILDKQLDKPCLSAHMASPECFKTSPGNARRMDIPAFPGNYGIPYKYTKTDRRPRWTTRMKLTRAIHGTSATRMKHMNAPARAIGNRTIVLNIIFLQTRWASPPYCCNRRLHLALPYIFQVAGLMHNPPRLANSCTMRALKEPPN